MQASLIDHSELSQLFFWFQPLSINFSDKQEALTWISTNNEINEHFTSHLQHEAWGMGLPIGFALIGAESWQHLFPSASAQSFFKRRLLSTTHPFPVLLWKGMEPHRSWPGEAVGQLCVQLAPAYSQDQAQSCSVFWKHLQHAWLMILSSSHIAHAHTFYVVYRRQEGSRKDGCSQTNHRASFEGLIMTHV